MRSRGKQISAFGVRPDILNRFKSWLVAKSETRFCRMGPLARIDVEKSASHQLSQNEISSDNPCYQQLFLGTPDRFRRRT
jgi:hypothetical protein